MSTGQIEVTRSIPLTHSLPTPIRATFSMCQPTLYDVSYVINPWMAGNIHASSRARAAEQWKNLYDTLSRIADVQLIEPQPGSPDMVFTANAGLEHSGAVAISSFLHPERQDEEPHFRRWFQKAGYTIVNIPDSPSCLKAKAMRFSPLTARASGRLRPAHPCLQPSRD